MGPGGDIDPCRGKGWRGGKGFGEEGAHPLFLQETGARSQGLGLGEVTAAPPKRREVETQEPLGTRIERPNLSLQPGDGGALKQAGSLSSLVPMGQTSVNLERPDVLAVQCSPGPQLPGRRKG